MCLGIPGEIRSIVEGELRAGRVAFGGVVKEVCLAYVPDAVVGDYVVVHAGFAISRVDREAAARTLAYLEEAAVALGGAPGETASEAEGKGGR